MLNALLQMNAIKHRELQHVQWLLSFQYADLLVLEYAVSQTKHIFNLLFSGLFWRNRVFAI